jgi:UTP:GlnB (protein PII) uridylyltransferase
MAGMSRIDWIVGVEKLNLYVISMTESRARATVRTARSAMRDTRPALAGARPTSVRFVDDERGKPALFVETADRGTLLLAIVRSIYKMGVRIAGSKITMRDDRARDWFYLVESDGSSIGAARQVQVEGTVRSAIATMDRVEDWLAG